MLISNLSNYNILESNVRNFTKSFTAPGFFNYYPSLGFILSPRTEKKEKEEDTDMMPKEERGDDDGDSSNLDACRKTGMGLNYFLGVGPHKVMNTMMRRAMGRKMMKV